MSCNIYLTGFMGSGKSFIGKALAEFLRRPFLDTDCRFQEKFLLSPGEFIRQKGEEEFRKAEQSVLKEIAQGEEFTVVSTGGGIPVYPGNRQIMKESGITATLQIPYAEISKRLTKKEKATRPLWSEERFLERQPFYLDCEIILDATRPLEHILNEFRQKASAFLEEAPYKTRLFQHILRQCAKDSADFGLLQPNDRILVGLSGGEDSFLLMEVLQKLKKRIPFPLEFIGVTVDVGYPGFDAAPIHEYCKKKGWKYHLKSVQGLYEFLKPEAVQGKPCPKCSRLRRGQLHAMLKECHCNKLALGHHLDDLCVSFLISLFHGGGLKTMAPYSIADGGKARLIRPLWGLKKQEIHQAAQYFQFPIISSCPYEDSLQEHGDRKYLEELLLSLNERFPNIQQAMRHSLGDLRLEHLLDKKYYPEIPGKD